MRDEETADFVYEWDQHQVLSAIGDEARCETVERKPHLLLRPIYINAVEVGFGYMQTDREHRLNVRGVTITLFYFISRGHSALALLPHCFKAYPEKSTNHSELMALYKMNLVEFTQGFGSEKYVEVNRMLVKRAAEVGGCIVARSQMHNIIEEIPELNVTVETRLLMPSFNGDDLIFPIDGPLGRYGPNLKATLECPLASSDWGAVSHHQLWLCDQTIWLRKICSLGKHNPLWDAITQELERFRPQTPLPKIELPKRPRISTVPRVHPPETNPPENHGYSHVRHMLRLEGHPLYSETAYGALLGINSKRDTVSYELKNDMAVPFLPEYLRTGVNRIEEPRFAELAPTQPMHLGDVPNSIYRIRSGNEEISRPINEEKPVEEQTDELVEKLAQIFERTLAEKVREKYKKVRNFPMLVEYALKESAEEEKIREETELAMRRNLIDLSADLSSMLEAPLIAASTPTLTLLD